MAPTSESFFLADRSVGVLKGAVSVASAWTWMTALFIIPLKSYQLGLPAFSVLVFVNVGLLPYTGYLADKVRRIIPKGFALPEYATKRDSAKTGYIIALSTVVVMQYAIAIHLKAISDVLVYVDFNRPLLVAACGFSAFLIACWRGLVTSVRADVVKACAIGAVVLLGAAVLVSSGPLIMSGLRGTRSLRAPLLPMHLWWTFMLPATLALMGSATFDGMLYQRAFAIERAADVLRTFARGAVVFAPVPLVLSLLGIMGAGSGIVVPKGQEDLVAFQIITTRLHVSPPLFAAAILTILVVTCTAALSAAGEVFVKSVIEPAGWETPFSSVGLSRAVMLVMIVIGVGIAYSGADIFTLWLTAGMVRAILLVPVLALILSPRSSVPSVRWWGLPIGLVGIASYVYWLGGNIFAAQSVQTDAIGIAGVAACATGLFIWMIRKALG